jgi:hypothetical protein
MLRAVQAFCEVERVVVWFAELQVHPDDIVDYWVQYDIVEDTPVSDKTGRMWKTWKHGKGASLSISTVKGKQYWKRFEPNPFFGEQ